MLIERSLRTIVVKTLVKDKKTGFVRLNKTDSSTGYK